MSEENFRNTPTTRYKDLYDPNLLTLSSASGSDWSSIIREECLAATKQPLEEEQSNLTGKTVLFGALAILVLWGGAMGVLASHVSRAVQEVSPKSVEQVFSRVTEPKNSIPIFNGNPLQGNESVI